MATSTNVLSVVLPRRAVCLKHKVTGCCVCFRAYTVEVISQAAAKARWRIDEQAGENLSLACVYEAEKNFSTHPFNKVIKRCQNGAGDSLHSFADFAVKAIRVEIEFGAQR